LEVYELKAGEYELLSGEPVWLSQLNLGIGRAEGIYQGINREWLYWYDEEGERYLTPEERIISAQQQVLSAQQKAEKLAQKLRELGIDPDRLDS
jgi:hypothetical protein